MDGLDIGSEVGKILGRLAHDNPDLAASARVKSAWNRIVDDATARHVTAVFVVPHTQAREVIVYVDSPIRAADFNMQVELLRMKLNVQLARMADVPVRSGEGQVAKLRFVASKERYLNHRFRVTPTDELDADERALEQVRPVPLSEDELAELSVAIGQVDDERLRDAALAAATANLEWQKGLRAYEGERRDRT